MINYVNGGKYSNRYDGVSSSNDATNSPLGSNLYVDTIVSNNGMENCGYRWNTNTRLRYVNSNASNKEYLLTNYAYEKYKTSMVAIKFYNASYQQKKITGKWSPDSVTESGHRYTYL